MRLPQAVLEFQLDGTGNLLISCGFGSEIRLLDSRQE
jgi:hypothetical protein